MGVKDATIRVLTLDVMEKIEKHPATIGMKLPVIERVRTEYGNYCEDAGRLMDRTFERVRQFLNLDLYGMRLEMDECRQVEESMQSIGLTCGRNIQWREQRLFTTRMQNLLDCHITEIGISQKIADMLDSFADIIKLSQLLNLKWEEIVAFSQPGPQSIPNFGPAAINEIDHCLHQNGFVRGSHIDWVREKRLRRSA